MASSSTVKYECVVCEEKEFKSRSDWLLHLVLNRHNAKARDSIQQLYLQSNGSFYVILGIENVDNTLLLDYISNRLSTFSNIISFKPEANLALIACDSKEFENFSKGLHYVKGEQLKFRDYNELKPGEWKSFFVKKPEVEYAGTVVKTGGTAQNGTLKRKLILRDRDIDKPFQTQTSSANKLPKLEVPVGLSERLREFMPSTRSLTSSTFNLVSWISEFNEMRDALLLSSGEQKVRLHALAELKKLFRQGYPYCELIQCGPDFLGFGFQKEEFVFYFDSQGLYNTENREKVRILHKEDWYYKEVLWKVFKVLKIAQQNGLVSNIHPIATDNADPESEIKFDFVAYGIIRLKCTILLQSFKKATMALLCKQLFFTNHQTMLLTLMAVYWWERAKYRWPLIQYPQACYWFIFTFLMKRKILPPVINLQKCCKYQILDNDVNVAFKYDPKILNMMANQDNMKIRNTRDSVGLLLDWFQFMTEVFVQSKSLLKESIWSLCPRYGVLFKKAFLKVCEELAGRPIKRKDGWKETQKAYKGALIEIGFEEESWSKMSTFNRAVPLAIQHPFYLSQNLAESMGKCAATLLLEDLQYTERMLRMAFETSEDSSFLAALVSKSKN